MNDSAPRTVFYALDGMRGIAAIAVFMFHMRNAFGGYNPEHAYLAVDLFFVMSGFVLAHAYEQKLSTDHMTGFQFIYLRLVRLWPLFVVSSVISLVGILVGDQYLTAEGWSAANLQKAFLLSLFMLPAPVNKDMILYPMNFVGWSLLCELIVNVGYAVFFKHLSHRVLLLVIGFCAAVLVVAIVVSSSHQVRGGDDVKSFPVGLVRAGLSFTAGLLAYRLFRSRRDAAIGGPKGVGLSLFCMAVVGMALLLRLPHVFNALFTPCFLMLCPVVVYVAALAEPTGAVKSVCRFLGQTSYGFYILHLPIGFTAIGLIQRAYSRDWALNAAPLSGIAIIVFILAITFLLDVYYDTPLRRGLIGFGKNTWILRQQKSLKS